MGQDLKTFCNTDSLYIATVVGNDGSVYVLRKEMNFDTEKFLLEYGKLAEKYKRYKNNATRAVAELLKKCKDYGMSYMKGGEL